MPGAVGSLRRLVFADVSLGQWVPPPGGQLAEPGTSFERARQLAQSGQLNEAVAIWEQIALADGVESRAALQAWHFVRRAGHAPRDETARYLNYAGRAVIWEDQQPGIQAAIHAWLATAQEPARLIGTRDQPSLRVTVRPRAALRTAPNRPNCMYLDAASVLRA
jgi:hypothetical protein